ncbi:phosphoribosylanthranilate isomerase [Pelomicrobium methylotrophicum]|uniref:N-(5'-phosphoribosyl)anthranilate isomerase n=1 Tax=Pelomicrobium methylotrophicum TaxID=2602750 RepID=A0A5C7EZI9_9PROT|nr:phosphoribosylanthranilate isomerase [Pelomicrobium methylotrophicum]TXF12782.1 phosphoribosylanthranilate isomerase [Pelomicrobium methylotrophicum]
MTAIKICGITRLQDAEAAARLGAHAIGLVFYRPSPRYVDPGRAAAIAQSVPPFITCVGLFVDPEPAWVEEVIRTVPLQLLQFHGDEPPAFCARYGLPFIKAVRVRPGLDLLEYSVRYREARGLVLDSYRAGVPGGTGERFDWSLVPGTLPLPVILSGGLTPENVAEAILAVRPWAVDVSSGVEADKGIKDWGKMAAFIDGVRNADVRLAR